MDIAMPALDGLDATRLIKAQRPGMKIVMLTSSAEDEDLFEAIKSGACGYLLKSTRGAAFIEALHGLQEGTPPFSPGLAARLLREFAHRGDGASIDAEGDRKTGDHSGDAETKNEQEPPKLTERQAEVLRLVAEGLTYKEVAARLMLSDHTVRYHMAEIMERLHLENRSQVIAYAGKLGIH